MDTKDEAASRRAVSESKYTKVVCLDEPGAGNACHVYEVIDRDRPLADGNVLGSVYFQRGPIQENGVNGVQNEDLLNIVVDRLRGFQSGQFSCRENAIALTKIEEALMWLNKRTADRQCRGVEGKSVL